MTNQLINIRGPSGAGKSWVARSVLSHFGVEEEVYGADQRTVEGYWLRSPQPTFLVGSYSAPTGGADALHGGFEEIADIIFRASQKGIVLFEGIRINAGHTHLINFVGNHNLYAEIIFLTTMEEDCYKNVLYRRNEVRNARNPENIRHWIRDHINRNRRQKSHFGENPRFRCLEMSSPEASEYLKQRLYTKKRLQES